MDWLGNMPERLVSNLEKWVSTDWLGSMKGRLENRQGLKGRMVVKESSVARSANSLEMWGSIVVTLGCSWGLLANIVDLLESRLDWLANSWGWSVNRPGRLLLVTQRHSLDCLENTMEMHLEMTGSMVTSMVPESLEILALVTTVVTFQKRPIVQTVRS